MLKATREDVGVEKGKRGRGIASCNLTVRGCYLVIIDVII